MPKSSSSGFPGAGVMTDTLEMVKQMWGSMNIPGMMMPSFSVDEINQQIANLKAVESWLALNMNMLRGTIQALEVQSATIANLRSMSDAMSAMAQQSTAFAKEAFSSPAASFDVTSDIKNHGADGAAGNGRAKRESAGNEKESAQSESGQSPFFFAPPTAEKPAAPQGENEPPQPLSGQQASQPSDAAPASFTLPYLSAETAGAAAPFANPAAWWEMLQTQFKQAVNTAMTAHPPQDAQKAHAESNTNARSGSKQPGGSANSKTAASSKTKTAVMSNTRPPARAKSKPASAASKRKTSR